MRRGGRVGRKNAAGSLDTGTVPYMPSLKSVSASLKRKDTVWISAVVNLIHGF